MRERLSLLMCFYWALTACSLGFGAAAAQDTAKPEAESAQTSEKDAENSSHLKRLTKDHDLWIDLKRKLVVVEGHVCLREGMLEMFACPKGTKEHESIVAVNCQAQYVHTALLLVGAKEGQPVQFAP